MILSEVLFFLFQAEDGIRDLVRSRGLGDVYKRQVRDGEDHVCGYVALENDVTEQVHQRNRLQAIFEGCLLYTSDAADERSSVDLGGRRIIKKKNTVARKQRSRHTQNHYNST